MEMEEEASVLDMDGVRRMTVPGDTESPVSTPSDVSVELFTRTSERMIYQCILSMTDLITRQIERFPYQLSNSSSRESIALGLSRSSFSVPEAVRSTMKSLSDDAWTIFRSLTSLIKQRASGYQSPSADSSIGQKNSETTDAGDLRNQLERLVSRVHEFERTSRESLLVQDSIVLSPEISELVARLRNPSQSDLSVASSEKLNRRLVDFYESAKEMGRFAGQRDALQNMAKVLSELDALVMSLDDITARGIEPDRRSYDYDDESSEQELSLSPKHGRHMLDSIVLESEGGMDLNAEGREGMDIPETRRNGHRSGSRSQDQLEIDGRKLLTRERLSDSHLEKSPSVASERRTNPKPSLIFTDSGKGTLGSSDAEHVDVLPDTHKKYKLNRDPLPKKFRQKDDAYYIVNQDSDSVEITPRSIDNKSQSSPRSESNSQESFKVERSLGDETHHHQDSNEKELSLCKDQPSCPKVFNTGSLDSHLTERDPELSIRTGSHSGRYSWLKSSTNLSVPRDKSETDNSHQWLQIPPSSIPDGNVDLAQIFDFIKSQNSELRSKSSDNHVAHATTSRFSNDGHHSSDILSIEAKEEIGIKETTRDISSNDIVVKQNTDTNHMRKFSEAHSPDKACDATTNEPSIKENVQSPETEYADTNQDTKSDQFDMNSFGLKKPRPGDRSTRTSEGGSSNVSLKSADTFWARQSTDCSENDEESLSRLVSNICENSAWEIADVLKKQLSAGNIQQHTQSLSTREEAAKQNNSEKSGDQANGNTDHGNGLKKRYPPNAAAINHNGSQTTQSSALSSGSTPGADVSDLDNTSDRSQRQRRMSSSHGSLYENVLMQLNDMMWKKIISAVNSEQDLQQMMNMSALSHDEEPHSYGVEPSTSVREYYPSKALVCKRDSKASQTAPGDLQKGHLSFGTKSDGCQSLRHSRAGTLDQNTRLEGNVKSDCESQHSQPNVLALKSSKTSEDTCDSIGARDVSTTYIDEDHGHWHRSSPILDYNAVSVDDIRSTSERQCYSLMSQASEASHGSRHNSDLIAAHSNGERRQMQSNGCISNRSSGSEEDLRINSERQYCPSCSTIDQDSSECRLVKEFSAANSDVGHSPGERHGSSSHGSLYEFALKQLNEMLAKKMLSASDSEEEDHGMPDYVSSDDTEGSKSHKATDEPSSFVKQHYPSYSDVSQNTGPASPSRGSTTRDSDQSGEGNLSGGISNGCSNSDLFDSALRELNSMIVNKLLSLTNSSEDQRQGIFDNRGSSPRTPDNKGQQLAEAKTSNMADKEVSQMDNKSNPVGMQGENLSIEPNDPDELSEMDESSSSNEGLDVWVRQKSLPSNSFEKQRTSRLSRSRNSRDSWQTCSSSSDNDQSPRLREEHNRTPLSTQPNNQKIKVCCGSSSGSNRNKMSTDGDDCSESGQGSIGSTRGVQTDEFDGHGRQDCPSNTVVNQKRSSTSSSSALQSRCGYKNDTEHKSREMSQRDVQSVPQGVSRKNVSPRGSNTSQRSSMSRPDRGTGAPVGDGTHASDEEGKAELSSVQQSCLCNRSANLASSHGSSQSSLENDRSELISKSSLVHGTKYNSAGCDNQCQPSCIRQSIPSDSRVSQRSSVSNLGSSWSNLGRDRSYTDDDRSPNKGQNDLTDENPCVNLQQRDDLVLESIVNERARSGCSQYSADEDTVCTDANNFVSYGRNRGLSDNDQIAELEKRHQNLEEQKNESVGGETQSISSGSSWSRLDRSKSFGSNDDRHSSDLGNCRDDQRFGREQIDADFPRRNVESERSETHNADLGRTWSRSDGNRSFTTTESLPVSVRVSNGFSDSEGQILGLEWSEINSKKSVSIGSGGSPSIGDRSSWSDLYRDRSITIRDADNASEREYTGLGDQSNADLMQAGERLSSQISIRSSEPQITKSIQNRDQDSLCSNSMHSSREANSHNARLYHSSEDSDCSVGRLSPGHSRHSRASSDSRSVSLKLDPTVYHSDEGLDSGMIEQSENQHMDSMSDILQEERNHAYSYGPFGSLSAGSGSSVSENLTNVSSVSDSERGSAPSRAASASIRSSSRDSSKRCAHHHSVQASSSERSRQSADQQGKIFPSSSSDMSEPDIKGGVSKESVVYGKFYTADNSGSEGESSNFFKKLDMTAPKISVSRYLSPSCKSVESVSWTTFPTASRSCPSLNASPIRRLTKWSFSTTLAESELSNGSWRVLVTFMSFVSFIFAVFAILAAALDTKHLSLSDCAEIFLEDVYKNLELKHVNGACF